MLRFGGLNGCLDVRLSLDKVAPDGDLKGYAEGLECYYRLFKSGAIETIRSKIAIEAKAAFSKETIVCQVCDVYEVAIRQANS